MRGFDIALTAMALRASATRPPEAKRELVPAVDDLDRASLDRAAISHAQAALISSLWPAPARQCLARPRYVALPAPAVFGVMYQVSWQAPAPTEDARALQARLNAAFADPAKGAT